MTCPEQPSFLPDDERNAYLGYVVLGQGGEYIVFNEPSDHLGLVRKVNIPLINRFNKDGQPIATAYEEAEAFAARLNSRHQGLTAVFGEAHTIGQTCAPHILALTAREIGHFWPNGPPVTGGSRFCTIITYQDRLRLLEQGHTGAGKWLSFDIPYAERLGRQVDIATYVSIHQRWLTDAAHKQELFDSEIDQFLALQNNASFGAVVHGLAQLPVNYAMADFITKAMLYSRASGEVLDLCGEQNVVFSEKGRYLLVDALMTKPDQRYAILPDLLTKIEQDTLLSFPERIHLLNALGYVRTMNFVACLLGLPDRLDVLPGAQIKPATWHKTYDYLTRLPTAKNMQVPTITYAA